MTYKCKLEIKIEQHEGRDRWYVYITDTPYGYVYGYGGTLIEALQHFDYNYVVLKERKESK